jgi:hypothetical protein
MLVNLDRCEWVGLWKNDEGPTLPQASGKHAVVAWTSKGEGGFPYIIWQGDDAEKAMDEFLAIEAKVTR